MVLLTLFFEFFKTGLFSVGGGMATVPFLMDMSVRHPDWFSAAQLADMIAVSESTPGPIGVNMATYVGFTVSGVIGSIIATLGLIAPEIIVILIISAFLNKFRSNPYVDSAFYGIRPCSVGLITVAGLLVAKITFLNSGIDLGDGLLKLINYKALILAAFLIVLTRFIKKTKGFHPAVFILFSAVVGVVFSF